ncbi:MAG: hypothetical protein ACM3MG_09575 [Bacillota bacterium]
MKRAAYLTTIKTTKTLSATLLAFLISQNAFSSSVVDSEFVLQLPRQFQEKLINDKWNSLSTKEFSGNWKLSDQIIKTSQVPVSLKGITLSVKTHLKKPTVADSQALLQLVSQDLSAEMTIAEVSVDTVIEKQVGGMIGKFRIQAKCENVPLVLRSGAGEFSLSLEPAVGSVKVGGEVKDVGMSWVPGAWMIGDFTCSGVEGFDVVLKDEIKKISDDSASFVNPQKQILKKYIADYLSSYDLDLSLPRKLVSARADISTTMVIDQYTEDAKTQAMNAKGRLRVEFKNSTTGNIKTLALSKTAVSLIQGTEAALVLPADFVKTVMSEAYSANSWIHHLNSSQVPGFSTIMNSRFSQFFVWPELMNYSKSALFKFDLYSNKDVQLTGSGLNYKVKMNLLSRMQAPRGNSYVNFMNFVMPFDSSVAFTVSSGAMTTSFSDVSLGLNAQWDPSYVANYSPSQRFSSGTIRDQIVGSLQGQTVKMNLPKIPLTSGVSLTVQSLKSLSNSDLLLRLAP